MTHYSITILFEETPMMPGSAGRVLGTVRVVPAVDCHCRRLVLIWSRRDEQNKLAAPVMPVEQTIARLQAWEANRTYQYAFTFDRTAGEYDPASSCYLCVRPQVYLAGRAQPDLPLDWTAVPASEELVRTSLLPDAATAWAERASQCP